MAIDSLGTSIAGTQALSQSTVDQEDLFKILLTQLKYQDPLKPTENSEFVAQLAQFTSLDQSRQTNENIQSLLQMQSSNQAVSLIGRTVQLTESSEVGQVTTVTFDQGTPQLTVKTTSGASINGISLSQLQIIR